jgi:hypothetical protein
MRLHTFLWLLVLPAGDALAADTVSRDDALSAFATVQAVFQHARCRNCHIPGDEPLQHDANLVHVPPVRRGPAGTGAPGLPCASCHAERNPPASYGERVPPGAPHWALPPPDQKMAWIGLDAGTVCAMLKDPKQNGGKDMDALEKHVGEDKLVLWGWQPGHGRAPVTIPHAEFLAAFRRWRAGGAPCPTPTRTAP